MNKWSDLNRHLSMDLSLWVMSSYVCTRPGTCLTVPGLTVVVVAVMSESMEVEFDRPSCKGRGCYLKACTT